MDKSFRAFLPAKCPCRDYGLEPGDFGLNTLCVIPDCPFQHENTTCFACESEVSQPLTMYASPLCALSGHSPSCASCVFSSLKSDVHPKCPDCNMDFDPANFREIANLVPHSEKRFIKRAIRLSAVKEYTARGDIGMANSIEPCPNCDCMGHLQFEKYDSDNWRVIQCVLCDERKQIPPVLNDNETILEAYRAIRALGAETGDLRECPHCKYPCIKDENCNHVTCNMCNREFIYNEAPLFTLPENISGADSTDNVDGDTESSDTESGDDENSSNRVNSRFC